MSALGHEARQLIEAARNERGLDAQTRALARRRLVKYLGSAAATVGATLPTAAAASMGSSVIVKLGVGVTLCGLAAAVSGGVWMSRHATTGTQLSAPTSSVSPMPAAETYTGRTNGDESPTERTKIHLPALSSPATSTGAVNPSQPSMVRTKVKSARPSRQAVPRATEARTDTGFAADARMLRAVHASLAAGRTEQALALLDDRRTDPDPGVLGPEREAARLVTLCKLGRLEEARPRLVSFLANHPGSPLVARVQRECGAEPGKGGIGPKRD